MSTRDHPEKIKYRSAFDGLCSQRGDRVLICGDTNTTNFSHNHCLSHSYPGEARSTPHRKHTVERGLVSRPSACPPRAGVLAVMPKERASGFPSHWVKRRKWLLRGSAPLPSSRFWPQTSEGRAAPTSAPAWSPRPPGPAGGMTLTRLPTRTFVQLLFLKFYSENFPTYPEAESTLQQTPDSAMTHVSTFLHLSPGFCSFVQQIPDIVSFQPLVLRKASRKTQTCFT